MTLTNNLAAKLTVAFVAVAMSLSMVAPAQAQTIEDLLKQIQQLESQISALQSGGGSSMSSDVCPYFWSRNLTVGDSGPDVMKLQQFLNANASTRVAASGVGSAGMETEYYGSLTGAAVAKFQEMYRNEVLAPLNLVNSTTYFGNSTRAQANKLCSSAMDDSDDSSDDSDDSSSSELRGGAGSITDSQIISSYSNEEVGEGQSDVVVFGLEVEPDGSDIEITAINVDFDKGASANSNFSKYAEDVSIWVDGELFARMDGDRFNRDNNFGRTITLDRGAIIREGDTGEILVAVSGLSNLDSADTGNSWDVGIDSVRFRDALGASVTDNSSNGIGGNDQSTTVASNERTFTFEDFATATNLKVSLRAGDNAINNARTIEVSSTTRTNNEDVFSFGVRVEGGAEVMVDDIRLSATTSPSAINDVISTAYLYLDGDRVGSENITATEESNGYIVFDNLDLDLDAGTHDFVVKVDFRRADGSNFSTGETISMDLVSADRGGWYIEDENGDQIASNDFSGTVSGDDHTLRTEGLHVDLVSSSGNETYNSNTPSSSYGTFTMEVELTAIGETMYVAETVAKSATASSTKGATFVLQDSSGSTYSGGTSTQSFTRVSGGTVTGNGRVRIDEGQTATFKLVVTLDPAASGQYRAQLVGAAFNTSDATPDTSVSATPASDYRTSYLLISN